MKLKTLKILGLIAIFYLGLYVAYMSYQFKTPRSISEVSQDYLGSPYTESPLGEGDPNGFDKDPLVRFDTFDNITFVETVMAERMAKTKNKYVVRYFLNKIRYMAGNIGFQSRNHIMSSDWIPNNSLYIREFQSPKTENMSVQIDRARWFSKMHMLLLNEKRRQGGVNYIPMDQIDEYDIPDETIAFVVRDYDLKDKYIYGTDLIVSDVGFGIRKDDDLKLYFRHASKEREIVLDEPFTEYMLNLQKEDSKIKGVAFYTIKY